MDNKTLEVDIGKRKDKFFLDIDGERILASKMLGELVDRLEKELKEHFGIQEKKGIGRFFGK